MIDEKELVEFLKKNLKIKQEKIERYHDMAPDGTYLSTRIYLGEEFIASVSMDIN